MVMKKSLKNGPVFGHFLEWPDFCPIFCDQKEKCPKSLLDWSLTIEKCSVVFSNNKKSRSNFRSGLSSQGWINFCLQKAAASKLM